MCHINVIINNPLHWSAQFVQFSWITITQMPQFFKNFIVNVSFKRKKKHNSINPLGKYNSTSHTWKQSFVVVVVQKFFCFGFRKLWNFNYLKIFYNFHPLHNQSTPLTQQVLSIKNILSLNVDAASSTFGPSRVSYAKVSMFWFLSRRLERAVKTGPPNYSTENVHNQSVPFTYLIKQGISTFEGLAYSRRCPTKDILSALILKTE